MKAKQEYDVNSNDPVRLRENYSSIKTDLHSIRMVEVKNATLASPSFDTIKIL